jgi:hypothetical protein
MSMSANPNYVTTLMEILRVVHLAMEDATRKDKTSLFWPNTINAFIKIKYILAILRHKETGDIALVKEGGEYVAGYYWIFKRLESGDIGRLTFIHAFGYVIVVQVHTQEKTRYVVGKD